MRSALAVFMIAALGGCGEDLRPPFAREDAGTALPDSGPPMIDAGSTDAPDGSGPADQREVDPRLQPGTGIERFLPLADGDTLRWEAGPQGGYHVFGAARVASPALDALPDDARNEIVHAYLLETEDGEQVARTVRAGRWVRTGAGYVARGILLVLEPGLSPYRVARSPLVYTVSLELPGETVRSSIRVRTACCD